MNHSDTPDLPEDQLPQDVVAALRKRYGPTGDIPEERDLAILQDANAHLSQISAPQRQPEDRRRFRLTTWSVGTLVAAALLISVIPWNLMDAPNPNMVSAPESGAGDMDALLRGDVDRNGTVNILDAYAMARDVKAGHPLPAEWDQNGDGQTDRLDVDLIAQRAVTL